MQQSGEDQQVRPPVPPFDEETARQKVKMAQDGLEHPRPREGLTRLHGGLQVAQPRGVLRGQGGHQGLPPAQVGQGARLQVREEPLVLHG
jgi:hypothetical protein